MGIFYRKKAFHAGKKIRKNDFAPSEKYSSYAPGSRQPRRATFSMFSRNSGGLHISDLLKKKKTFISDYLHHFQTVA